MKETKIQPCYCGGEMKIKKVPQNGGMDGTYWDWELTCKKCGLTMTYAADDFYGRKYKTLEEVVDDWNRDKKKEGIVKDNIFEKLTDEEKDHLWMYMIFNQDKIKAKTEQWTKEAEEAGMTLTEYLETINYPLNDRKEDKE